MQKNKTKGSIYHDSLNVRKKKGAFYTDDFLIEEIMNKLPSFNNKKSLRILEPSVGKGNFLSHLIKKYGNKKLVIDVVDIDKKSINYLKEQYQNLLKNIHINYYTHDFITLDLQNNFYDLTIGNPPFITLKKDDYYKNISAIFNEKKSINLLSFFIIKAMKISDFISFVLPKNFLLANHYQSIRNQIEQNEIKSILDFENKGFDKVTLETINIIFKMTGTNDNNDVIINNVIKGFLDNKKQKYICDKYFPNWIIYRNKDFDNFLKRIDIDIFKSYRDRQITNSCLSNSGTIRVLRSRNVGKNEIINRDSDYDKFLKRNMVPTDLSIYKFIDEDVFLCPNLTYNIRVVKKPKGVLVNGSIAIIKPKTNINNLDSRILIMNTNEYYNFFSIATNFQKNTINIDKVTTFYLGVWKE